MKSTRFLMIVPPTQKKNEESKLLIQQIRSNKGAASSIDFSSALSRVSFSKKNDALPIRVFKQIKILSTSSLVGL